MTPQPLRNSGEVLPPFRPHRSGGAKVSTGAGSEVTRRIVLVLALIGVLVLGRAPEVGAIYRGAPAVPGAYPFMVSLRITDGSEEYLCGGSLVADEWVLTAAHCLTHVAEPEALRVYAGSDHVWAGDEISARRSWVHPEFSTEHLDNDIALVRLSRPPRPDVKVASIRLSTEPSRYTDLPLGISPTPSQLIQSIHRDVEVAGWGQVGPSKKDRISPVLQVLPLRVTSSRYCELRSRLPLLRLLQARLFSLQLESGAIREILDLVAASNPRAVPYGALCASASIDMFGNPLGTGSAGTLFGLDPLQVWGENAATPFAVSIESEPDSCQGDSGGPLFATEPDGTRLQVGIVSYGKATPTLTCSATVAPPVYTNVAVYADWIRSVMAAPDR